MNPEGTLVSLQGKGVADFDYIRAWATDWATNWGLQETVSLFEIDMLAAIRPLRIEVFNILFSVGLSEAGLSSDLDRGGLNAFLKRKGMDRMVRGCALRLPLSRGRRKVSSPMLGIVSEMAAPSALFPSAAIASTFEQYSVLVFAADPRAARYWHRQGLAVNPLVLPLRKQWAIMSRVRSKFPPLWSAFKANPPSISLVGRDLAPAVFPRLHSLLRHTLPWLHVERQALRTALESKPPKVLLLASDQHRIGVLAAAEAHRIGIPTAVIQHGLPQHDIGYVPVNANRVLTWSESANDWFLSRGTRPSRLSVVGNPVFDKYLSRPDPSRGRAREAAGSRMLAVLTPSTRTINRLVVSRCLDAIGKLPGAELIVKLHPGDGEWNYIRELVRGHKSASRTRVVHRAPLPPFLHWADVTCLHRSSVAVESLACGTPVLVIAAAGRSTADSELLGLDLPVVNSAQELAQSFSKHLNPSTRSSYFQSRRILHFVGPVGTAAENARRVLLDLAKDGLRSQ